MSILKITTEEMKDLAYVVAQCLEHGGKKCSKELHNAAAVVLRLFILFEQEKNANAEKEQETKKQVEKEQLERLSDTMRDESLPTCERLRAAELLGKHYISEKEKNSKKAANSAKSEKL